MNYEDAILDFLSRTENLPIALEVSEYTERLKVKLHKEFWFASHDVLQDLLAQSERASGWAARMRSEEGLLRDWTKCSLVPLSVSRGQRCARIALEQGRGSLGYPLYYGVAWNKELSGELNVKEFRALADGLKGEGFKSDRWWIGRQDLGHSIGSRDFLLRMAADKDNFVEEIIQIVWALFERKCASIEALNRALASA